MEANAIKKPRSHYSGPVDVAARDKEFVGFFPSGQWIWNNWDLGVVSEGFSALFH